ncbi:4Fe-4S binding protein [Marivita hallyeonensis]|uniref:4Fe-4S dicluster domain-containing protein n=1 Tax=Marivita hallyeonensis TaxID=996342 RepID=A0A1M5NA97_9RHOB|nr:4Fe-4S binding protein [Marivita hallyeonensis]SHG85923.1 4Fe-4S dicluster domain-containing protein [Marivita hallyeonensis]
MGTKLILCDCLGSQSVDAPRIAEASGLEVSRVHTNLCGAEADAAAKLMEDSDVIVACAQESAFFEMLAEEIGVDAPACVDIRDRAGWSDEGAQAAPKMAALAAEAKLQIPMPKVVDVVSEGTCLLVGTGDTVFEAAAKLCGTLAVTVLQTDTSDVPADRRFDVVRGAIRNLSGALGGFKVRIDRFSMLQPGGRGAFTFSDPKDGAVSECDIVIDLTGDQAMVPAPHKREGYFRADPRQPIMVADVMAEAMQMVGTFEKPLYIALEPAICAHSRAEQAGCSKCLNICPTGAITSAGDHVAIDPMICAGCGACVALCPSGAITYDAPPVSAVFRRLDALATTYRKAGGTHPHLLVHDAEHGGEMIRLAARFGRGLPADVIPFETDTLAGFGHAEMMAALGCGFASIDVLLAPKTERDTPTVEAALANALAGKEAVRLLDLMDPDALSDALFGAEQAKSIATPNLPIGTRRQVARVAAKALNPEADILALPDAAPYGAVLVNTDACTLCLSCVSLCPSGALGDNPDLPQLLFQEDACLQCGLCANICPEDAIALEPRMNLTDAALSQVVLNEEEPFACIECGALFGVKSTIEKITEKLAGKHSMFANESAAKMIQMCDNCRISAQYHSENNPFAMGEPRKPRTTDDYLSDTPYSKRRDH